MMGDPAAVYFDHRAWFRRDYTGDDLDERAFAGTIFSH
jgi:hypothetical protein